MSGEMGGDKKRDGGGGVDGEKYQIWYGGMAKMYES